MDWRVIQSNNNRKDTSVTMFHQFTQSRKATSLALVPGNKIDRAFLEEFAKAGTVRVTKTVNEESQPVFTFIQEAK